MLLLQLKKRCLKIKCLSASTKQTCFFSPKYGVFSFVFICTSQDFNMKCASTFKLDQSDWSFYFHLLAQTGHIAHCVSHLSCILCSLCSMLCSRLSPSLNPELLENRDLCFHLRVSRLWGTTLAKVKQKAAYLHGGQESDKGTGSQSSEEPSWT